MAVLLFEIALGGLALLWVTPLWGVVRPGFFKLVGAVLVACAGLSWYTASAARAADVAWTASGGPGAAAAVLSDAEAMLRAGGRAVALLGVFAVVVLAWYVLVWLGWAPTPAAKPKAGPARGAGG